MGLGQSLRSADAPGPGAADAVVVKFGSSVLRSLGDIPAVVSEIYRQVRQGRRVVAVVSAFAGETDRLIEEAACFGADLRSRHAPRLVSLGEERTASLLAIACDQVGLDARIVGPRELDLRASGDVDDATPRRVDAALLQAHLSAHDVVIVPGFVAIGDTGEPVLLGRGGSDLTAVVLADALGLAAVSLLKDVDGVYDRDPAIDGRDAQRYKQLSWADARRVAGKLLQPKAVAFAEDRGVGIRVARLNAVEETQVGAVTTAPGPGRPERRINVAVAGLGVIGEGLALRLIAEPQRFRLVGALVSGRTKVRHRQIDPKGITADMDTFLDAGPDIVVDALSCGVTGRRLVERAIERGIACVVANKQAIAADLAELRAMAAHSGVGFHYAAAVGGGAPMVETARRAAATGRPVALEAVLNGTVNFILSRIDGGADFETALIEAQGAGFAEADPSADLGGLDAVAKLKILAVEAFGTPLAAQNIVIEALDAEKATAFRRAGGGVRQISRIDRSATGEIAASVTYRKAEETGPFHGLAGERNALWIALDSGEVVTCRGRGAGRAPTVESLLADIAEVERSLVLA